VSVPTEPPIRAEPRRTVKSITVQQLRERENVPLIDVREVDEFAAGHVPGAVNLPMSSIGERLDELPDEPFDVICQLGGRSARVVEALSARGHDATNVDGGTSAWTEAGYDLDR
jgi:rhodanese-related sulfurtransferase